MKKIKLVIQEPAVSTIISSEMMLSLPEEASLVDAINEVDGMIKSKGDFPLAEYHSLLHMVYDPVKNRFYNQVAVTAYREPGEMVMVRDNPRAVLPEGVTVVLIPSGGCVGEWEEAIDYEKFHKALSGK